jgi:hypothetical protein
VKRSGRSRAISGLAALLMVVSGAIQSSPPARPADQAVQQALGEARAVGQASLRWFGIRVYDAVLWVESPAAVERRRALGPSAATGSLAAPFDREFVLEIDYAMALSGHRIAERSDHEIARQPDRAPAQRAAWLEQMKALFPDVRAGDRLTGHYRPGQPTRFFLNDRPLGEISDPAFGPAFFGIWLSPGTSEPAMREALLRGLGAAGAGTRAH